ncbi:hypothetical protein [Nannocystis pusilla]|uniref:hypothetical protein n=1 Tax=Nannocystis pusilla TaxID=889268 RepID=UPI003B75EFFA
MPEDDEEDPRAVAGEDEDDEGDEDDATTEPPTPPERRVYMEIRSRGTRGPAGKNGRGRLVLGDYVRQTTVDDLQQMTLGEDAALCEPITIWVGDSYGDKLRQVRATAQSPRQVAEQTSRANAEHDREMEELRAQLRDKRTEIQQAEHQLDLLQRRIRLEETQIAGLEAQRDQVRMQLDSDRKRADDERSILNAERAQRLHERAALVKQDLEERQRLQELGKAERERAYSDAAGITGMVQTFANTTTQNFSDNLAAMQLQLKQAQEQSKTLLAQEHVLQEAIQASTLNAISNSGDLKERMEAVAASATPAPDPNAKPIDWMELAEKGLGGFMAALSMITKQPLPGVSSD